MMKRLPILIHLFFLAAIVMLSARWFYFSHFDDLNSRNQALFLADLMLETECSTKKMHYGILEEETRFPYDPRNHFAYDRINSLFRLYDSTAQALRILDKSSSKKDLDNASHWVSRCEDSLRNNFFVNQYNTDTICKKLLERSGKLLLSLTNEQSMAVTARYLLQRIARLINHEVTSWAHYLSNNFCGFGRYQIITNYSPLCPMPGDTLHLRSLLGELRSFNNPYSSIAVNGKNVDMRYDRPVFKGCWSDPGIYPLKISVSHLDLEGKLDTTETIYHIRVLGR